MERRKSFMKKRESFIDKNSFHNRAFLSFNAFKHNVEVVKKEYNNSFIIFPVKANAYGHGILEMVDFAIKCDINFFAVARSDEALTVREFARDSRIMLLGVEFDDGIRTAIDNGIELSVSSLAECENIDKIARKIKVKNVKVHLNFDTGMTRLGCTDDEFIKIVQFIDSSENLVFESFYSHFAQSDEDMNFTMLQLEIYKDKVSSLREVKIEPSFYHINNSGGVLNIEREDYDFLDGRDTAIRPGIMLYGYGSILNTKKNILEPVMTLFSKVLLIRKVCKGTSIGYGRTYTVDSDCSIATVGIGYGDGLMRCLSNKFSVKINNVEYRVVGRISMDLITVLVDDRVKVGDDVVVFGNKKSALYDAEDIAEFCGTISYEITTLLSSRILRTKSE